MTDQIPSRFTIRVYAIILNSNFTFPIDKHVAHLLKEYLIGKS